MTEKIPVLVNERSLPSCCASVELRREAIALFKKGLGYKSVAARIGVNVHTVRDWGRRYRRGVFTEDIASRLHRWDESVKQAVRQLHQMGLSLGAISRRTGVPKSTVKGWIDAAECRTQSASGQKKSPD